MISKRKSRGSSSLGAAVAKKPTRSEEVGEDTARLNEGGREGRRGGGEGRLNEGLKLRNTRATRPQPLQRKSQTHVGLDVSKRGTNSTAPTPALAPVTCKASGQRQSLADFLSVGI
jgi:hypothetical protein